jgi:hypothetical protein
MVDSVGLILLDKLVPQPVMAKSGGGSRAVECRTYGARHHPTSIPQPFPLLPPLAALERVASAVFFTENRIECNAPTSTTGKQGPGWADVWPPALRALTNYQVAHSMVPSEVATDPGAAFPKEKPHFATLACTE